ncbi:MAG: right-handed parallel beta-helix repeat-containing protein, partial [Planctomycetes bacterium]|nr:right-handed parallel beta-helix repeat-containing protein [Planctomycetota bacterium]
MTLYVATSGNDAWSGRLAEPNADKTDGPYATLDRARDELRELRTADGLPGGATVCLRSGVYYLTAPFVLTPEDSGTEQGPITYAPFPGDTVSLKGSRPVTGWTVYRDGIYVADLAGQDLAKAAFRDVYWRGQRQGPARTPNVDPQHPRSGGFAYAGRVVENESKTLLRYKPDQIDPNRWQTPTKARVHVWSWLNWNRSIVPIQSVDTANGVITFARPASYKIIEGNRYFVENVFEELDAPGEWYLDDATGKFYFQPPGGEEPDAESVTVPVAAGLILFEGDGNKRQFVQHIRIRGFSLSECHGGAVRMSAAAHCAVVGCDIRNCGTESRKPFSTAAIEIRDRSHHNRIAGCDIAHVGSSAIVLSEVVDWQHCLDDRVSFNAIDNNHIHHVGEWGDAWGAIRVNPGCGGNVSHDNVISHNLVHDTPRQGISFNGFRNVIEYNHVHHTNQEQSDTGAIGMGSRDVEERGSIIRFNYVHDTGGYNMVKPGVWEYPHYCWGIYLDDFTSGVYVYGNVVVRTYRGGVMVHGGQDNVIENNIIVDGKSQQIEYAPIDEHASGRNPANPAPNQMEWRMKGTRLIRNVFSYADDKANWLRGRLWEQVVADSNWNLIWPYGKPVAMNLDKTPPDECWAAWQKLGFDRDSLIADPMFVDAAKDDYRLRPESPAFTLGFQPIPIEKV